MKNKLWLIIVTGLLTAPASLQAAVIYDNLGPGESFTGGSGWMVSGVNIIGYETLSGMAFTATSSGLVTSVDLAMGIFDDGVSWDGQSSLTINLELRHDAGDTPGALIEALTISVSDVFPVSGISTALASGTTLLTGGQQYWLVASPSANSDWVMWNRNDQGVTGLVWMGGLDAFSDQTLGAFRLNADLVSVPEPAAMALFGIGLMGMGLARRRRS